MHMRFDGLFQLLSIPAISRFEEEFSRSSSLFEEMTHAARFRTDLGKVECLTSEMNDVAELELGLIASKHQVLCVHREKSSDFAAASVVVRLFLTLVPGG